MSLPRKRLSSSFTSSLGQAGFVRFCNFQPVVKFLIFLGLIVNSPAVVTPQTESGYGILFMDSVPPGFEARIKEFADKHFQALNFGAPTAHGKITVTCEWVEIARFPIPKPASFELFTLGLEAGDRDRIIASGRTIFLNFTYPSKEAVPAIHLISRFIAAAIDEPQAAVWDDENRQIISAKEWTKLRIDSWNGDQIDIRRHITMHAYRDPELQRIITLGLRKFDLPDLILEGVPAEISRPAGNTVNYLAQLLAEQGYAGQDKFELNLKDIRHPAVKQSALEYPLKGAIASATVSLSETKPEQGDPNNLLLKIGFPEALGKDSSEHLAQGLAALYGAEKDVLFAKGNDTELLTARDKARHTFLGKKSLFKAGLKPNERLLVKYGFTNGTDHEYMWVEVYAWDGDELSGVVLNNARLIDGIIAGKRVKIPVPEIYDYLHYFPDGTDEGNETGKILQHRQGEK